MLFNESLDNLNNYFRSQQISPFGKGYETIMTDPNLFESYVQCLTTGVNGDHQVELAQLIRNGNTELINESSVAAIAPVSSMSGPMIKKLWPKFCMKNAVNTKVTTSPAFMINWTRPYYITVDTDGFEQRHYIPDELYGAGHTAQDLGSNYKDVDVALASVAANSTDSNKSDLSSIVYSGSAQADQTASTVSKITKQPFDRDFTLVSVDIYDKATAGTLTKVAVNKKLGIENSMAVEVGDFTLLLKVIPEKAKYQVAVINNAGSTKVLAKVHCRAHLSTEYNENAVSFSFDVKREDIIVGTGDHMMSSVTAEYLKDLNAMYSMDGTKACIDLMTNAFAAQIDEKIYNFLKDSFASQPGQVEDFKAYPVATKYLAVFDVKPEAGFAAGPKAWREELKPVIDHLAARIKNATHLGAGRFKIIGNPLDIQLITNVEWKYRNGQGTMDGVAVDYSLGEYQGSAYSYDIVSTETIAQGKIYLDFIPATAEQLTYNYYAYSFTTEMGFRDPLHSLVPTVCMTNRDAVKDFLPAIGAIAIIGNDGNENYNPFRDFVPTKTSTSTADEAGAYAVEK